jgi:two-component system LytT family response regulator
MNKIRLIIADDERPAREYLRSILNEIDECEIVGEAENGAKAVELIRSLKPDLALLDLQMPEVSGLDVVRILRKDQMPQIAFVTAFDEYAVKAFELNAVDYLLKPVEKVRVMETISRAVERLEREDHRTDETTNVRNAAKVLDSMSGQDLIERIPVKKRNEILLVQVADVVSVVADGEHLIITTFAGEKHVINFRLKDLESRLDDSKFVRLSRGAIVNIEAIKQVSPLPGGTYLIKLKNGQEIASSRLQSKLLRGKLLKI